LNFSGALSQKQKPSLSFQSQQSDQSVFAGKAPGAGECVRHESSAGGAKTPDALDDAFAGLAAQRPDALHIISDSGTSDLSDRIAARALMRRIPSFATTPDFAGVGGLLAYGASRQRLFIRSGYYVKRILDGSRPGDLPVEQPTRVELWINSRPRKHSIWKYPRQ